MMTKIAIRVLMTKLGSELLAKPTLISVNLCMTNLGVFGPVNLLGYKEK